MGRLTAGILAASLLAGAMGCCAGPCRFYENAYGWNNPDIERYCPGPPPPVTTPPGYSTPVDPDVVAAESGRPSKSVLPESEDPAGPDGPEDVLPPAPNAPSGSSPPRYAPAVIMPASHDEPVAGAQRGVIAPPRWTNE